MQPTMKCRVVSLAALASRGLGPNSCRAALTPRPSSPFSSVPSARRHAHSNGRAFAPRPEVAKKQSTTVRRLFTSSKTSTKKPRSFVAPVASVIVFGASLMYSLFPTEGLQLQDGNRESSSQSTDTLDAIRERIKEKVDNLREHGLPLGADGDQKDKDAWFDFTSSFEGLSNTADIEWSDVSDRIADLILPDWSKLMPTYIRKLQQELSLLPGSLADEIWDEAHDPLINPEVQYAAKVRVSDELCNEEKAFREHRKRVTARALARYLDLDPDEVNPDDVPVIALCGSGGGLRALVAGAGSLLAAKQAGLFDCATYSAGVSGSCWMQSLYFSSISQQKLSRVVDHLKSRLGIHIAYPPAALALLTSAPTNKNLLSGVVERIRGDPKAGFGLVDVYGILLATRLLVPKGELDVNEQDFKISNQRQYISRGQEPMPIYTAVRHEIPALEVSEESKGKGGDSNDSASSLSSQEKEEAKEEAKQKAYFQWFEVTPYEFFCEELGAGIPTWAMGRKFNAGRDIPPNEGEYHLPETRLTLLLGVFGSAFCATLSHYYKEIRPIIQSLTGFGPLDEMIWGRNEDLVKVHPIDPALLPNPVYGMSAKQLPDTVPPGLLEREYIQLMDAGMSNNLPLYPFMRPGRGVEVAIVFDASADVKQDNWLNVADGYARQRGVKGWPIGVGWPQGDADPKTTAEQLVSAQEGSRTTTEDAETKLTEAKVDQAVSRIEDGSTSNSGADDGEKKTAAAPALKDLGHCTIWVGSTQEKVSKPGDHSAPSDEPAELEPVPIIDETNKWRLTAPDAGLTLVYIPYIKNDKVPGVDPATSEFMSTWNFVYTPDDVDSAVGLAQANFKEGADQIKTTVRAVYERKKQLRLDSIKEREKARYRRMIRLGINDRLVGDDFS